MSINLGRRTHYAARQASPRPFDQVCRDMALEMSSNFFTFSVARSRNQVSGALQTQTFVPKRNV